MLIKLKSKNGIVNKGYGGISLYFMNTTMLLSIALTGFSVAFFHAAIPTHWLPFVMAARTQKWNRSKTVAVTAIAGAGHVLLTTVLGVVIVWLGIELDKKVGHWFPLIAGGALIAFGLYYLNQQRRGVRHGHGHFSLGGRMHDHHHPRDHGRHHDHSHPHDYHHDHHSGGHGHGHHHDHDRHEERLASPSLMGHSLTQGGEIRELHTFETVAGVPLQALEKKRKVVSDRVAILSLLAMLTFSPCEGFLPVYLSGISYGWIGFAILSLILAAATLLGMVAFTWLTLAGMEKLKLAFLEKYESGLMGAVLCLLGLAVIIFEH